MIKTKLAILAGLAGIAMSAAPAAAVLSTFAGYRQVTLNGTSPKTVRWTNNGAAVPASGGNPAIGAGLVGTGGILSNITRNNGTVGSPVIDTRVLFYYQALPFLSALGEIPATFSIFAASNTPASTSAGKLVQTLTAGSTFEFRSLSAINVGNKAFAAGSLLLGGVFNGSLSGVPFATSANVNASTANGDTILFSSDFLTFKPNSAYDIGLTLAAVLPTIFQRNTNTGNPVGRGPKALRTFNANSTGLFSSDPAPLVFLPEPQVWAMMVVGFGMVGVQVRRRNRRSTVAA